MKHPTSLFPVRVYFCIAVSALGFLGCGRTAEPNQTTVAVTPASTETTQADPNEADLQPPDKSLAFDDYVVVGIPGYEQVWSGENMLEVATVLMQIAVEDPAKLPRKDSQKSGRVFARMTAEENLGRYQDSELDLEQRFAELMTWQQATRLLLRVYVLAENQKAVGPQDVVEVTAVQLRITGMILESIDEILPILDPSDPNSVRPEQLWQMQSGLARILLSTIVILTEDNRYKTSDRKRLAKHLESTLPQIVPHLPKANQLETIGNLHRLAADPNLEYIKPELDTLIAVVEKSLEIRDSN